MQGHMQSLLYRKALSEHFQFKGSNQRHSSWTGPGMEPGTLILQSVNQPGAFTFFSPLPAPKLDAVEHTQ